MPGSTFQNRLKDAMSRAGLKQVDLVRLAAEKGAKLGKSQVSQYVSGKVEPRPEALELLAELLGVDAAWLGGAAGASSEPANRPAFKPASQPIASQRQRTSSESDHNLYQGSKPM